MKIIYNPQTMSQYVLDKNGKIKCFYNKNRICKCNNCESVKEITQHGKYQGLCQKCRRKQYYKDNKEHENYLCRKNYHENDGKIKMYERRFGGNYKNTIKKNKKCIYCGSEDNLDVHHIDKTGWKSTGTYLISNNSINNLITLCHSCHAKYHSGSISYSHT